MRNSAGLKAEPRPVDGYKSQRRCPEPNRSPIEY